MRMALGGCLSTEGTWNVWAHASFPAPEASAGFTLAGRVMSLRGFWRRTRHLASEALPVGSLHGNHGVRNIGVNGLRSLATMRFLEPWV